MHGSASVSHVEQERTGGEHRPGLEPHGGAGGGPGSSSEREPTESADAPRAVHADLVVLAFVLARCEEQLAEVIRSLEGQGIIRQDIVAEAAALASEAAGDPPFRPADVYADALLTVDFRQRTVELGGEELALTPLEFRLLAAFVRHPRQVLSHEQLLELAWGDSRWVTREQLRLTVSYLRRKLGAGGRQAIETVRGFGYRYRPNV
jgi:DNA-binding response OmpR family regulator